MRKLIFMFFAVTMFTMSSCGNQTGTSSKSDTTVVDTADTVVGDSLVADSL